jgi:sodium transport system permease protein
MNDILIILKKELTELLRDKKTLINSVILPILLIPVIIIGFTKVIKLLDEKDQQKTIKVGLYNAPQDFLQLVENDSLNKITTFTEEEDFKALIDDNTVQTAIAFPADWTRQMDSLNTAEIKVYRNGSKDNVNGRVNKMVEAYNTLLKEQRVERLQIPMAQLKPFVKTNMEVGEQKEVIGKRIGGFVPYIFILSMWGGCLLAAIDLVTGEKERKTIETTLTLPISKFKVLVGKSIAASLLGFIPAVLNVVGLVVAVQLVSDIPASFQPVIAEMLSPKSIILILLLLLPFSIFLAGSLIALITGATNFKEASSKAAPLIMLLIFPLIIATMPNVELNWSTVFIPVLNIGLGVKEIMAGTIDMTQYAVILISLIAFAMGAIYLSYKKFSDENSILK